MRAVIRAIAASVVALGPAATAAQAPPPGMAAYQIAFLRRAAGPAPAEIQKAHLAHLDRLEKEGVLVGAGPIRGDGDLRGVLILKAGSLERAREHASADPAVAAGRLSIEVLPWWGPDDVGAGYFAAVKARPDAPPRMITYQLGLLRAGPQRGQAKEEAERIQAAHLAHIASMAKSGKLVAAGPFLHDGELRGIFLFDATPDEARALAAADPAVQAGRLRLDFHSWMVAEGVFTPRAAP